MAPPDIDLTKEVSAKVKGLSANRVKEVLDFIEFLSLKEKKKPKKGSPKTILKHIGTWRFEGGELDGILKEIAELREMEG